MRHRHSYSFISFLVLFFSFAYSSGCANDVRSILHSITELPTGNIRAIGRSTFRADARNHQKGAGTLSVVDFLSSGRPYLSQPLKGNSRKNGHYWKRFPHFSVSTCQTLTKPDGSSFALMMLRSQISPGILGEPNQRYALCRIRPNGGIDENFGNKGAHYFDFTDNPTASFGLVPAPNGVLVLFSTLGYSPSSFSSYAIKINHSGNIDTRFGVEGRKNLPGRGIGSQSQITPSGNFFVLIGSRVRKFDHEAEIDHSFNSGFELFVGSAAVIASLRDEGLLVGYHTNLLERFDRHGNWQSDFGNNGGVIFETNQKFSQLIPMNDGRILVLFNSHREVGGSFNAPWLACLHPNGELDSDFGTGGSIYFRFNSSGISGFVSKSGDILINEIPYLGGGVQVEFVVLKFDDSGNLDTSFGKNGKATADFDINLPDVSVTIRKRNLGQDGVYSRNGYSQSASIRHSRRRSIRFSFKVENDGFGLRYSQARCLFRRRGIKSNFFHRYYGDRRNNSMIGKTYGFRFRPLGSLEAYRFDAVIRIPRNFPSRSIRFRVQMISRGPKALDTALLNFHLGSPYGKQSASRPSFFQ